MKPERNMYKLKLEILAKYMKQKELKLTEYVVKKKENLDKQQN